MALGEVKIRKGVLPKKRTEYVGIFNLMSCWNSIPSFSLVAGQ